jgi:hypothetical protein
MWESAMYHYQDGDVHSNGLMMALQGSLDDLAPEAKRDLAAQLLRSASESEGHIEGAPDATDGGTLSRAVREAYFRGQADERALTQLLGIGAADSEVTITHHSGHYGAPLDQCPNDGYECPDHPGVTHHKSDSDLDVMQRSRLANGGCGETDAPAGKFQRAAEAAHHKSDSGVPDDERWAQIKEERVIREQADQ